MRTFYDVIREEMTDWQNELARLERACVAKQITAIKLTLHYAQKRLASENRKVRKMARKAAEANYKVAVYNIAEYLHEERRHELRGQIAELEKTLRRLQRKLNSNK